MKPPEQFRGGRTSGRQWKAAAAVAHSGRSQRLTDRPEAVVAPGGGSYCRSCGVIRRWRQKSLVVALLALISPRRTFGGAAAAVAAHTV